MKLYHVSKINKGQKIIDMCKNKKNDVKYVLFLMDEIYNYDRFYKAYRSEQMNTISNEKGWTREKIAAEAIFENIRRSEYTESPSRLLYAYFTDSLEKAKTFNKDQRNNEGDYFSFDADEDKVYYYNMDVFTEAADSLKNGFSKQSFDFVKKKAKEYWTTSKSGNVEILYKGKPILLNISESII